MNKKGSPKTPPLQRRLCPYISRPQPSSCLRISAKSNSEDWPLTTTEGKASPWQLPAAFHTCSLGRQGEQLYLFPQVLSRKQGLREALCLASSSKPDKSDHKRGVTLRAEASPQAAARGKRRALSITVWGEARGDRPAQPPLATLNYPSGEAV